MNLSSIVDTVDTLNIDKQLSNSSSNAEILVSDTNIDKSHYIISDADAELLILIQFKEMVNLKLIKLYGSIDSVNDISDDEKDDISLPKQIHIYKLNYLNVNFDDLERLNPDKSMKCSIKKLAKGQNINLQKDAKLTLKLKPIQY